MIKPSVPDIQSMSRRAYINNDAGHTKVIFGRDEWQVVFRVTSGIDAKRKVTNGDFTASMIEVAVIDDSVLAIREALSRLDKQMSELIDGAEVLEGFRMYSREHSVKTDKIAYEITNIMTYGILKEER